jgi:hypothetical protein
MVPPLDRDGRAAHQNARTTFSGEAGRVRPLEVV